MSCEIFGILFVVAVFVLIFYKVSKIVTRCLDRRSDASSVQRGRSLSWPDLKINGDNPISADDILEFLRNLPSVTTKYSYAYPDEPWSTKCYEIGQLSDQDLHNLYFETYYEILTKVRETGLSDLGFAKIGNSWPTVVDIHVPYAQTLAHVYLNIAAQGNQLIVEWGHYPDNHTVYYGDNSSRHFNDRYVMFAQIVEKQIIDVCDRKFL